MTSQSPRIYVYKITFEEVPYYYYGVHKENRFNEEYWGSPTTNKWCWELYTPKKQILQLFNFSDEGWIEAQEVEKRLIRQFYNTDKWCLNENCGGIISIEICTKAGKVGGKIGGKIVGKRLVKLKKGIHGRSLEERKEDCKKGGERTLQLKTGVHARSEEQRKKDSRKGGKKAAELKLGVHGRSKEKMTEDGKKGGKIAGRKNKENKVGIFGRTEEQKLEDRINGGKVSGRMSVELKYGAHGRSKEKWSKDSKIAGSIGGKISTSQVWECTVTGYRSNAAALSRYQKKRNIDTSNRIRIS
jgi:hypothetical protein